MKVMQQNKPDMMLTDTSKHEDWMSKMQYTLSISDLVSLDMSRIACHGMEGDLDKWEVAQPPELHGKAPSGQDLKFVVRILLDVMNLIDRSQEISQECDVELVTCNTS